jgi:hypothetical protein
LLAKLEKTYSRFSQDIHCSANSGGVFFTATESA